MACASKEELQKTEDKLSKDLAKLGKQNETLMHNQQVLLTAIYELQNQIRQLATK